MEEYLKKLLSVEFSDWVFDDISKTRVIIIKNGVKFKSLLYSTFDRSNDEIAFIHFSNLVKQRKIHDKILQLMLKAQEFKPFPQCIKCNNEFTRKTYCNVIDYDTGLEYDALKVTCQWIQNLNHGCGFFWFMKCADKEMNASNNNENDQR